MSDSAVQSSMRRRKRDDLTVYEVDGEVLVHDAVAGGTHRLNSTARFIWDCCDGCRGVEDIAQSLIDVFDLSEGEAQTHASSMVSRLHSLGLVD